VLFILPGTLSLFRGNEEAGAPSYGMPGAPPLSVSFHLQGAATPAPVPAPASTARSPVTGRVSAGKTVTRRDPVKPDTAAATQENTPRDPPAADSPAADSPVADSRAANRDTEHRPGAADPLAKSAALRDSPDSVPPAGPTTGPPAASPNAAIRSHGGPATPGSGTELGSKPLSRPQPTLIGNIEVEYPYAARAQGVEGTCVVQAEIDEQGAVSRVTVQQSSGSDLLDRAALGQVRRARFRPRLLAGKPVADTTTVRVSFVLQDQ